MPSDPEHPTVSGIIHEVGETQTFGQRGFRKRVVVLEQPDGRFMNYIPVELLKDACELADHLKAGDEVEVSYRLSGRKWQRDPSSEVKYFLSAEALEIRVLSGSDSAAAPGSAPGPWDADDPGPQEPGPEGVSDDDIPF